MRSPTVPTSRLLDIFTDVIAAHGGQVTDTADDGRRLLARSVLPALAEVRPGDRIQGGVAVRAAGPDVWVYPFVFRLVCRNGAIIAQTVRTKHVSIPATGVNPEWAVREAVGECCGADVFAEMTERFRTARDTSADLVVMLMPLLSGPSGSDASHFLADIMDLFFQDGDRSRYGLANAVTAVAREVRDPDQRWELEEFGGGIAVGTSPPSRRPPPPLAARRRRELAAGAT